MYEFAAATAAVLDDRESLPGSEQTAWTCGTAASSGSLSNPMLIAGSASTPTNRCFLRRVGALGELSRWMYGQLGNNKRGWKVEVIEHMATYILWAIWGAVDHRPLDSSNLDCHMQFVHNLFMQREHQNICGLDFVQYCLIYWKGHLTAEQSDSFNGMRRWHVVLSTDKS